MAYLLAIDPSINSCGYAVFEHEQISPILYNVISSRVLETKRQEYIAKSRAVFEKVRSIQAQFENCKIILEVPEYRKSAHMARESDAIVKLSFVCGMISALDNVIHYTPSQWKGQVPKDVMRRRLSGIITDIDIMRIKSHDTVDAIGLGYYYITKLSKE